MSAESEFFKNLIRADKAAFAVNGLIRDIIWKRTAIGDTDLAAYITANPDDKNVAMGQTKLVAIMNALSAVSAEIDANAADIVEGLIE